MRLGGFEVVHKEPWELFLIAMYLLGELQAATGDKRNHIQEQYNMVLAELVRRRDKQRGERVKEDIRPVVGQVYRNRWGLRYRITDIKDSGNHTVYYVGLNPQECGGHMHLVDFMHDVSDGTWVLEES